MQPQTAALNAVIDLIKPDISVQIGVLPIDGGVSIEIAAGWGNCYLNKQKQRRTLPLLFLCKKKSQAEAFDTLCEIGNKLSRLDAQGYETFQILYFKMKSEASLAVKDGDFWIYTMIIEMEIYF